MKFLLDRFPIFIVACLTVLVFTLSGLIFLNLNIRKNVEQMVSSDLKSNTEQQAYHFFARLDGLQDIVSALSKNISFDGNLNNAPTSVLNGFVNETQFDSFSVVDVKGNAVSDLGRTEDMSENILFQKSIKGETFILGPVFSATNQTPLISIAAPIVRNDKIVGVIVGSFRAEKLNNWLNSSFDGFSSVHIVDNRGQIIACADAKKILPDSNANFFASLEQNHFYDGQSFATILSNLENKHSGYAKYQEDNEEHLMYYAKTSRYDWNIFAVVPDSIVANFKNSIIWQIYALSAMLIILSMGFLYWMVRMQANHVKRIEDAAYIDPLTEAATILKFKMDVQKILIENPDKSFILAKFDIDRFKLINKIFGYTEGDSIIRTVVRALHQNADRDKGSYARGNIDEFLVLYEANKSARLLKDEFVQTFLSMMGECFKYNINFPTGYYSIVAGATREDISSMMEKVNIAHRSAKQSGLELCIYDEDMVSVALAKKELENKMEQGLQDREFKVFLQPKYELENERIVGAEALVRWSSGTGDMIYPDSFIPLFEENGFIIKLDTYMFDEVCRLIRSWLDQGLEPLPISVNFSKNQLNNTGFVQTLCEITNKHNVQRDLLEIEITESAIIENAAAMLNVLEQLHDAKFKLAMDDFGSGYSSLGMLKNIPVDIIKIDRSFFNAQIEDIRAKIVIRNIMRMAKELDIVTVAEGIETKEYVDFLKSIKCDIVQGYYYSRPIAADAFTAMLAAKCP